MRKASLFVSITCCSILGSLAFVVACASSSTPTIGGGGKDGSPPPEVDSRRPYPSFRDDVVPIVRDACALAACHSSKESNLGILLKEDPVQIYGELQKTSPTATGHKFVVPGDATASHLMVKLEGRQDALAADCTAAPLKTCGVAMPPDNKLPTDQLDTFRKWITEGAKDN